MSRADLPALLDWLADPGVHRWWPGDETIASLEADYLPAAGGTTQAWVVEIDGVASGLIQSYRLEDEPGWTATVVAAVPELAPRTMVGIDYLIGRPEARNRGVGSSMLARWGARVFAEWPDVDTIVVTVHQDNRPSWRALERAGWRRIWAGALDSDDPSDAGPSYLLIRTR